MLTPLVLITVLLAWGGSVHGQSLGEATPKEKERRAKLPGSSKSYTDSDLSDAASRRAKEGGPSPVSSPPPSVAPTKGAPAGAPVVSPDSASSTDLSQSDALKKSRGIYHKGRLAELDGHLKVAEEDLRAAEKHWNVMQSHPWEFPTEFDKARSWFEAAKKKVELLLRQRDEIEDDARREGIPPGYLR